MVQSSKNEILAVIGARSGSKSIPHKNIRPLCGKFLLGWIIEAAKNSCLINRVIVSTDSKEYIKIANGCGAEAPFLRPTEISGDTSSDLEYIVHALGWLGDQEGYFPDVVVRLIPTVPLQRPEDIDACVRRLLEDSNLDSVVGVAEARQHPGKALKINNLGHLVPYLADFTLNTYPHARQVYEKAYFRGNIIATRAEVLRGGSLYGERSGYHVIPSLYAMDIDSEMDFLFIETLLEKGLIK